MDGVLELCQETLQKKKQALVFVNAKKSAEKTAEDLAKKLKVKTPELEALAAQIETVLSKPTKQCERLALCLRGGTAFHHAGLHAQQKTLVENAFRSGVLGIIACTPTLAMGLDLPAFRAVITSTKRFGQHGMHFIPVLEYLQMAGRAGRPKFDTVGEAILISSTEAERDELLERYIRGEPEEIYSKLAVEPVLRTYILSLIASRVVSTRTQLLDFFGQTFWAHQFKDMGKLSATIDKMLKLLMDWEFIAGPEKEEFVSAKDYGKDAFKATFLGKRVAELYLDPLTAFQFVTALKKAANTKTTKPVSFLHTVCTTLEMRPLLRVGTREFDVVQKKLVEWDQWLLVNEPSAFDPEYEEYLDAVKTAMMFADWIEECDEEYLLETYKVRPGELNAKLDNADWLLYGMIELSNILNVNEIIKELYRVRTRLKYGAKEELLPLLKLEGIGKIRARKMFGAGMKDIGDVRKISLEKLTDVLGKAVAANVKKQVGS